MPETPCGHCPDHVELASDIAVVKSTVLRLEEMANETRDRDQQFGIDIALLKYDAVQEGGKAGRRGGTVTAAAITGLILGAGKLISWFLGGT